MQPPKLPEPNEWSSQEGDWVQEKKNPTYTLLRPKWKPLVCVKQVRGRTLLVDPGKKGSKLISIDNCRPVPKVFEPQIEDELEMATVCYRPEGLRQLQAQTNFTKRELQVLYRGFKNECPSGVVNEETFKQIYSQFFPQGDASMYAHYLFNAFDSAHNGSIKFE
ncbi:hypothetical protein scyTo_0018984, partial [Scyliorhinus torazame]|nr:hypothetical protein [Scyliorhinus torazame]